MQETENIIFNPRPEHLSFTYCNEAARTTKGKNPRKFKYSVGYKPFAAWERISEIDDPMCTASYILRFSIN